MLDNIRQLPYRRNIETIGRHAFGRQTASLPGPQFSLQDSNGSALWVARRSTHPARQLIEEAVRRSQEGLRPAQAIAMSAPVSRGTIVRNYGLSMRLTGLCGLDPGSIAPTNRIFGRLRSVSRVGRKRVHEAARETGMASAL